MFDTWHTSYDQHLFQSMVLYILVIVAVSLLYMITVSCNVVSANNISNNINNNRDGGRIDEQRRRRYLTNNNHDGDNLTTFIVGGTETSKGDVPYLVSIGNSGRRGGHGKCLIATCCVWLICLSLMFKN